MVSSSSNVPLSFFAPESLVKRGFRGSDCQGRFPENSLLDVKFQ